MPYDSGRRERRMGAGPSALVRAGAVDRLRARGYEVHEQAVEPTSPWRAELRTTFELLRGIAAAAARSHEAGRVPLLLSGNCHGTLGMLAALHTAGSGVRPARRVGLVWLDAHGDFHTPETDAGGFLDGHGLAMAVGRCWGAATATVPGFAPLPEERVLLVGARSLDDAEERALRASRVAWLPAAAGRDRAAVRAAVDRLAADVDVVHLHVDLDVHDPSVGPANDYAAPDGLTAGQVQDVVREVASRLRVGSATLASYDPAHDPEGRMQDVALDLLTLLADLAAP